MIETTLNLISGNRQRQCLVHSPDNWQPGGRCALVFHGGESNPAGVARQSGFDRAVDQGFLVAYPQGTAPFPGATRFSFNAGGGDAGWSAKAGIDDVTFTQDLLALLTSKYQPAQFYVSGFSVGAGMCYKLLQSPQRSKFAAFAPISGSIVRGEAVPSVPPAVRWLHMHGLSDNHCPYTGGVGSDAMDQLDWLPAHDMVSAIATAVDGCTGPSSILSTADYISETWSKNGVSSVELYTFPGCGHTWPGGVNPPNLGATATFDATAKIIAFFSA